MDLFRNKLNAKHITIDLKLPFERGESTRAVTEQQRSPPLSLTLITQRSIPYILSVRPNVRIKSALNLLH